ncbi:DUF4928 family protein [Solidesulfovibrio sp.]
MNALEKRLADYRRVRRFVGKGQLAVALHVTRQGLRRGLPLSPDALVTEGTGQVAGLSKSAVQAILADYGITRVLAEEGGRTSRGSLGNMRDYLTFLNELHGCGLADLKAIEAWWIERVKDFFSGKPFVLRYDPGKSLRSLVTDLLSQAAKRQKDNPGTMYAGTVLQHLVGAKLDTILPEHAHLEHHGASVADAPGARSGDFLVEGVAIHVTTAATESLIRKCIKNIESGLTPLIVTISESRPGLESLAKGFGVDARIDIVEAEQFIATNIHEWSQFDGNRRKKEIVKLFSRYNSIVESVETDPSLKIEIP